MFQEIYNVLPVSQKKWQRVDTAIAFFQLSRMLSAGVSLSDALSDLAIIDNSARHHSMWKNVSKRVNAGSALSEALTATSGKTDKTLIALLKAGEAGGQLHIACNAIYEYLQWHHELRQRIYTLLIYPLFSFCVLVGVTGFLFISVVPSIKGFLVSSGGDLEWHTQALIGFSTWMSHYYLRTSGACFVFILVMVLGLVCSQRVRVLCHGCLLRLPLIGKLTIDLMLSRYASCCAQLYANGVALESAMELAEGTVKNHVMRTELSNARRAMVGGATLADAMSYVSILPPLFVRLVRVGEISGQLTDVLNQLSEHQSVRAEASIKRMEQLVGPLMLMVVGAMLLWIVVSILGPVYNMAIATVVGAA